MIQGAGQLRAITFFTITVIGYLLLVRKHGLIVTLSAVGGVLLSNLLKHEFEDPVRIWDPIVWRFIPNAFLAVTPWCRRSSI
jgi:hypothetical protein